MVVIFSMPSTRMAMRDLRRRKMRAAGVGRKPKVEGSVDDVKVQIAAMNGVADFRQAGFVDVDGGAGEAVYAADFLNGRGRNSKELIAGAEKNNLLRASGSDFLWGGHAHQRAPTGVALLIARTRFSMAA